MPSSKTKVKHNPKTHIDPSKLGPKAKEWHDQAIPSDPLFHSTACLEDFAKAHGVEFPFLHTIPEFLLPDDPYTNPLHSVRKEMIKGKGKKKVGSIEPCETCGELHHRHTGTSETTEAGPRFENYRGFLDHFPFLTTADWPLPPHLEHYIVFLQQTAIVERLRTFNTGQRLYEMRREYESAMRHYNAALYRAAIWSHVAHTAVQDNEEVAKEVEAVSERLVELEVRLKDVEQKNKILKAELEIAHERGMSGDTTSKKVEHRPIPAAQRD